MNEKIEHFIEPLPVFEDDLSWEDLPEELFEPLSQPTPFNALDKPVVFLELSAELNAINKEKDNRYLYNAFKRFWFQDNQRPFSTVLKQLANNVFPSLSFLEEFLGFLLKNDLLRGHYFRLLTPKYESYLFSEIIKMAFKFIPHSALFIERMTYDEPYSFYDDVSHLEYIKDFIRTFDEIEHLQQIELEEEHSLWTHFKECLANNKSNQIAYLIALQAYYIDFYLKDIKQLEESDPFKYFAQRQFFEFLGRAQENNFSRQLTYERHKKFPILADLPLLKRYDSSTRSKSPAMDEVEITCNTDLSVDKTALLDKKKTDWENSQNTDDARAYETEILKAENNLAKAHHILNWAKAQLDTKLVLEGQLMRIQKQLSLSIGIYKLALGKKNQDVLSQAYDLRARTYQRLAKNFPSYSTGQSHNFTKAEEDYAQVHQSKQVDANFVAIYHNAKEKNDLLQSVTLYGKAIKLNPYYWEAHYQRLIAYYELNDLMQFHRISRRFNAIKSVLDLLTTLKKGDASSFLNKVIKVTIRNHAQYPLYLKIRLIDGCYELSCSSEFSLKCLLSQGQHRIKLINKEKVLAHHYHDDDLKNIIDNMSIQEQQHVSNLKTYISYFAEYDVVNRFAPLDKQIRLLMTLPACREQLITHYMHTRKFAKANYHIAKALADCQKLLALCNEDKQEHKQTIAYIKQCCSTLTMKRAGIYHQELKTFQKLKERRLNEEQESNLVVFVTKNKPENDIAAACHRFLNELLKKSFDASQEESLDRFHSLCRSLMDVRTLKAFYELIICPQGNERADFWVRLVNWPLNDSLNDFLESFKERFCNSIAVFQELQKKQNDELALKQIMLQNKEKQFSVILKQIDLFLVSLSDKHFVEPLCDNYQKLMTLVQSEQSQLEKIQAIFGFLNIDISPDDKKYFSKQKVLLDGIIELTTSALRPPQISFNMSEIRIDGYNVFLSQVQSQIEEYLSTNPHLGTVFINGTNVFLDSSLNPPNWQGKNLQVMAECIDLSNGISIDVSGKEGKPGLYVENQPHAFRTGESGKHGRPGQNGGAGQHGGDVSLIASKRLSSSRFKLNVSGGIGGVGGNGGNGGNAKKGKDGQHAAEDMPSATDYTLVKGEKGQFGGSGGHGGAAGLGGFGGKAGIILITERNIDLTHTFKDRFEDTNYSETAAADGLPGEGGKGALGGVDGYDALCINPGKLKENKVEKRRGIVVTKSIKEPYIDPAYMVLGAVAGGLIGLTVIATLAMTDVLSVEWTVDERDEQNLRETKRGHEGKQGLSADAQINQGARRSKAAQKQHQEIKQQQTITAQAQMQYVVETEAAENQHELEKTALQQQAQQQRINLVAEMVGIATTYQKSTVMEQRSQLHTIQQKASSTTSTFFTSTVIINQSANSVIRVRTSVLKAKTSILDDVIKQKEKIKLELIEKLNKGITRLIEFRTNKKQNARALFFSQSLHTLEDNRLSYLDGGKRLSILIENKKVLCKLDYASVMSELRQKYMEKTCIEKINSLDALCHNCMKHDITVEVAQFEQSLNQNISLY